MTPNLLDELEPCPFCGHAGPFDQWPCEWLDATETNVIRCLMCHGAAPAARWNKRTHAPALADMAKRLEAAERDARRYRWLRDKAWSIPAIAQQELPAVAIFSGSGRRCKDVSGEEMDTAIDTAIDATQEGEG